VLEQDEKHSHSEIWREIGATYLAASMFATPKTRSRNSSTAVLTIRRTLLLRQDARTTRQQAEAREVFARCVEAVKTMPSYRYREHRKWDKARREDSLKSHRLHRRKRESRVDLRGLVNALTTDRVANVFDRFSNFPSALPKPSFTCRRIICLALSGEIVVVESSADSLFRFAFSLIPFSFNFVSIR
jgi:hypothetical protein